MKKTFLSVGVVCLIIFLAVSFSAATCTVTPGPTPTTYLLSIQNSSGFTIRVLFNGVPLSGNVFNGSQYNKYVEPGVIVDAQYYSSESWYDIRGGEHQKFPVAMPYTSISTTVWPSDIGLSSER